MSGFLWKMGAESFDSLMEFIGASEPCSLEMTRLVSQHRFWREKALQNAQKSIKMLTNAIKELLTERNVLKQHRQDIERNKDFTYDIVVQYKIRGFSEERVTFFNCKDCGVTCFEEVLAGSNNVKDFMKEFIGYSCPTCPKRCSSDVHQGEDEPFVIRTTKIRRHSNYLRRKYGQGQKKKLTLKHAIDQCSSRISLVLQQQQQPFRFLEQVQEHFHVLCDVALHHTFTSKEAKIQREIEILLNKNRRIEHGNFVQELRSLEWKIAASSPNVSANDSEEVYDSLEELFQSSDEQEV